MALALMAAIQQPDPALAVLNSPNASIPRTVDAALRRSIPAFNTDVLTIQVRAPYLLGCNDLSMSLPFGVMVGHVHVQGFRDQRVSLLLS